MKTECPVCEEEVEISEKEIRGALRKAIDGMALVGCPNCCRVLVLPKIEGDVEQWIINVSENEDWIPCLELEGVVGDMPTGFEEHMGVKEYQPGSGHKKYPRREYMRAYGVDPACALIKMGRTEGAEPFKIGGRK